MKRAIVDLDAETAHAHMVLEASLAVIETMEAERDRLKLYHDWLLDRVKEDEKRLLNAITQARAAHGRLLATMARATSAPPPPLQRTISCHDLSKKIKLDEEAPSSKK